MVPGNDTDVAQERWSQAEWQNYELWEKIESRMRRRKWFWIMGAVALYLILSCIPIFLDRIPKWETLSLTRHVAQLINEVKSRSAAGHEAFRVTFVTPGKFNYIIEKLSDCKQANGAVVGQGQIADGAPAEKYVLLSPRQGDELGIPGLSSSFCYDPINGSVQTTSDQALIGFAAIPVKDLSEKRLDRASVLLIKGISAETSFE